MNEAGAVDPASKPPAAFAARMAILYIALFLHVGVLLPYFPLWLQQRGLSATVISLVLTMPLVMRILTSGYISTYADRVPERANVMIGLFAGTAILVAVYPFATGFWAILSVALVVSIFQNPMAPVMDAITLAGVRRFGFDYGRIRLWGSLVFILANVAAGQVLAVYGDRTIIWMLIATAIAGLALSLLTPRLGQPPKPATKIQVASASPWNLLRNRRFLLVAAGIALIQGTHAMIYSFGSIYWNDAGFSGTAIGAFWGIGVLAEVIPRFVIRTLSGKAPIVFGDGSNGRDFTYVTDTADGLWRTAFNDRVVGQTVNLGWGRAVSVKQVGEEILRQCGCNDLTLEHVAERPGDIHSLIARTEKAAEILGFRPRVDFATGIANYVAWFKQRYANPAKLLEADHRNWTLPA